MNMRVQRMFRFGSNFVTKVFIPEGDVLEFLDFPFLSETEFIGLKHWDSITSQKELASIIKTSPSKISSYRKKFEEYKLIEKSKKMVVTDFGKEILKLFAIFYEDPKL